MAKTIKGMLETLVASGAAPDVSGNVTPTAAGATIPAGYHDGTGKTTPDADLVTANIKAGITIFGVAGKASVVDTASGDAVAGDIALGKKAWVNGVEITGTAV
jgi:hypothetical protein